MDYMNFNELDVMNYFQKMTETVIDLYFEDNKNKRTFLYNKYREIAKETEELIIGKVRDLDEARAKAKELAEQVDDLITLSQRISDQVSKFI